MINFTDLVAKGQELLAYAKQVMIPYTRNGMTLAGMDCQGLCESLLIQCGLSKREVNLTGSNAHWRQSHRWRGSIEEAVALFGDIPDGAWLFIHAYDGEEPGQYKSDGQGNASHMGQYLSGGVAVHASASRGFVAESAVKRKSINGGWNMVALPKWVRFSDKVEGVLAGLDGVSVPEMTEAEYFQEEVAPASSPRYVRVLTPDGHGVRAREQPSLKAIYKYTVPDGTVLQVLADKGDFWKVHYQGKARYVDKRFVVEERR